MKASEEATIVGMPREASVQGEDKYLVEMTERLQKLRSLVGEPTTPKQARRRISNRQFFPNVM